MRFTRLSLSHQVALMVALIRSLVIGSLAWIVASRRMAELAAGMQQELQRFRIT